MLIWNRLLAMTIVACKMLMVADLVAHSGVPANVADEMNLCVVVPDNLNFVIVVESNLGIVVVLLCPVPVQPWEILYSYMK